MNFIILSGGEDDFLKNSNNENTKKRPSSKANFYANFYFALFASLLTMSYRGNRIWYGFFLFL